MRGVAKKKYLSPITLKREMDAMKTLLKEETLILNTTEENYKKALDSMKGLDGPLAHLSKELKIIIEWDIPNQTRATDKKYTQIGYGGFGAGFLVAIGADLAGCMGACSILYTVYGSILTPVSIAIAKKVKKGHMEDFKENIDQVIGIFQSLENNMEDAVAFFDQEIAIINQFEQAIKYFHAKLAKNNFAQYTYWGFKDRILDTLDELEQVAKRCLSQPSTI